MEPIRTKDKLFLALVVPAAAVAAYVWLWRADAVRTVGELEREEAGLVTTEDYPFERQKAERLLSEAREELKVEEERPQPALKVKAGADDSTAARERIVLGVFSRMGLVVESSRAAENADPAAGEALRQTGVRPNPVCRRYAIAGSYPQICAALKVFAERELAVIPVRVEMSAAGHWTCILWL